MNNYDYYLIIDFEATCCDHSSVPKQEMEIIEFGAVMLQRGTMQIVDEFQSFIRPVRNPQLTPFCTELTTITQQDVDAAPDFASVISALKQWLKPYSNYVFCSWGDYDRYQLDKDCNYHQVAYPLAAGHINVKKCFSEALGLRRKLGLGKAINLMGLSFSGTAHRGIDDARNIAALMPFILNHDTSN